MTSLVGNVFMISCSMQKIYASASTAVHGPVKYVYTNVDFSNVTIPIPGSTVCP